MKSTITALHLADMHVSENNLHQIEPALKQIEEIQQDLKPDLVVFAGDAWVRRGSFTAHEEFIFKSFILNLAESSKVLLIPGNHDQVNRWDRMDSITGVFTRQTNSKRIPIHNNLIVSAVPKILPIKLGGRIYQIFTLPHPSKYLFLTSKPGSGRNLEESIAH